MVKAEFRISAFQLPWQQIQRRAFAHFLCLVADYSTNFSKKFRQNICNEIAINANLHFSYYKSMEFKLAIAMTVHEQQQKKKKKCKNINIVEANATIFCFNDSVKLLSKYLAVTWQ